MHDLVYQSSVLGTMAVMTTHAIGVRHGNPLVGIFQGRAQQVVTRLAQTSTRISDKSLCIAKVWYVTFQALPLICRSMLKGVLFHFFSQFQMTRQAQGANRAIKSPLNFAAMRIVAFGTFAGPDRVMSKCVCRHGFLHGFMARVAIALPGLM
jgi:hypothetical protein